MIRKKRIKKNLRTKKVKRFYSFAEGLLYYMRRDKKLSDAMVLLCNGGYNPKDEQTNFMDFMKPLVLEETTRMYNWEIMKIKAEEDEQKSKNNNN